MVAAVRLTVLTGPHKDHRFCFCGPTRCLAGRALDCFVQFSGTARDEFISRHHCQLDIDPPCMLVHDLNSSNGTYVNGKKVEGVELSGVSTGHALLKHGDLLTLGGTTLRVDFLECPHASTDGEGQPHWGEGETVKKDCLSDC